MANLPVDLRSDTVTRPGPEMRRAIASAEVGDDVFGDDPTVHALEEEVAGLLGKEAAVFVPSGTMANQIAVATHTERGDEVLLEEGAHIFQYEAGSPALLSGVQLWPIRGEDGRIPLASVRERIRPRDQHFPRTRLLSLENTHNRAGGRVLPLDYLRLATDLARESGIVTHLDGSRLWNAAAATGQAEAEFGALFDSVSVCFSKGLGAPVGSALAGARDWVGEARRYRKRFGGGMRQAGLLAAGALFALRHHRSRLAEDHQLAQRLALGLREVPGMSCDPQEVETNIVVVEVAGEVAGWVDRLKDRGIWAVPFGAQSVRFVTHLDVGPEEIDLAIRSAREVSAELD